MKIFKNKLQIQKDMQEALDAAWATNDPATRAFQEELFPEGKPTLEQFIAKISEHVILQTCSETGGV